MLDKTFGELVKDKPGTIYWQGEVNGYRGLIQRGGASVCAYLGLPKDHPLAGADVDEIDLPVHGGLTFASWGDGEGGWEKDLYWIGWDYGHLGDINFYDIDIFSKVPEYSTDLYLEGLIRDDQIRWTPAMVLPELQIAAAFLPEISQSVSGFEKLHRKWRKWSKEIHHRWSRFTIRIGYRTWLLKRWQR